MLNKINKLIVTLSVLTIYCIVAGVAVGQDSANASNIDIFEANKRLGRGINLGNFLEVPRAADWDIKIELHHLDAIKQAGFDSIRIPIKWSDYAGSESPFAIEEEFAKRVDSLLDKAEKVGLTVVLNIHHYDGLDQAPNAHKDRFVSIWKQLASRYKNRGDFLYFELNNEPHEKLNDQWNEILKLGLAAVRQSNPTRPVIVGPPFWNGIWALPKLELPDDKQLIVTVHMYNPHEFTHQGTSWSNPEVRSIRNREFGKVEEIAKVVKELEDAAAWGKAHQVPIYVGEFGAFNLAPQASRIKWTETIARNCERMEMSWAYWEFGAGFGAYDLPNGKWHNDLLKVLLPKG